MKRTTKKIKEPVKPVIPVEALHWPTEPRPTPMSKEVQWGELKTGWWVNAYRALDSCNSGVGEGCFNGLHHSTWSKTAINAQGQGQFYATQKEALIELRYRVSEMAAIALNRIDEQLKECN